MLRLLFTLSLTLTGLLFAELPPQYYLEMQANAPEQLRIRVVTVSRDWYFWRDTRRVRVIAKVLGVVKTSAGLKDGMQIAFEYDAFTPSGGWTGPSPMPVLKKNQECDFFGERAGVAKDLGIMLTPTARGYSFEKMP